MCWWMGMRLVLWHYSRHASNFLPCGRTDKRPALLPWAGSDSVPADSGSAGLNTLPGRQDKQTLRYLPLCCLSASFTCSPFSPPSLPPHLPLPLYPSLSLTYPHLSLFSLPTSLPTHHFPPPSFLHYSYPHFVFSFLVNRQACALFLRAHWGFGGWTGRDCCARWLGKGRAWQAAFETDRQNRPTWAGDRAWFGDGAWGRTGHPQTPCCVWRRFGLAV